MAAKRKRKKKPKTTIVDLKDVREHNGEGRPDLQFPDPISGEMIGGQRAFMRMTLRLRHVVCPWARRQGKSKTRPFIWINEAMITPGEYYAGVCFPDHTTAAKIADNFRKSLGNFVRSYKINDKDQDRWIELNPIVPPPGCPPAEWLTPSLKKRWYAAQDGDVNEYSRIYFWSCKHPHYEGVQGFPHPFHRVDWDECQQIHPLAYDIIRPMLRDVAGHEAFTGTPWYKGIGNVQFKKWWGLAGGSDPLPGWFRMRIPDGTNPHVIPVTKDEMREMTQEAIRQTMWAEFLTGEGAVFSNIDKVCRLLPLKKDASELDFCRALRSGNSMPSMKWWVHRPKPLEGHIHGVTVDWARSPTGDFTVVMVFDLTTAEQVALFRWRGEDISSQLSAVLEIQRHYGADQLHSDAQGLGGAVIADLMRQRHALGFRLHKFGSNKFEAYVRRGQVLFQDIDVSLIDCPEQKHEFESFSAFESDTLGSTAIKYCAPQGENDDIVAAFLQIAPTLTIIGRQLPPEPEPLPQDVFDEKGQTSLERWVGEDGALPAFMREDYEEEEEGVSLDDVLLPHWF